MPSLAETISRLNEARARPAPRTAVAGDRLSDLDDFGSNPGQLRARVHVPAGLARGAALVVVLHGCTQSAAGYDVASGWSQLADRHGFAVLFPEQRQSNNPNLCFNWFVPHHAQRGGGEALSIKQMVDTVSARHAIDPGKVFVTGLSAGGAMAAVMLATYPEVFAGGAIIAGLPYGMASSVPSAFQLMGGRTATDPLELMAKVRAASGHQGPWPRVSVWHGTADRTVDAANAQALIDQWRLLHDAPAQPAKMETVDGFPRRAWRDAQGREVIEEYMIPNMGHGTPLNTAGGTGRGAPFMLDVGICSTIETLRFWGLADARTAERKAARKPSAPTRQPQPIRPNTPLEEIIRAEPVRPRSPALAGPGKIIEDALRAAGLMR